MKKITTADLTGKGVVGLADNPQMSSLDLQKKFDEIGKDVIIPAYNIMVEDLQVAQYEKMVISPTVKAIGLDAKYQMTLSLDRNNFEPVKVRGDKASFSANGITATNVQDAIIEVFTSAGSLKSDIATAVTGKGVATPSVADKATIVANIKAIGNQSTVTASTLVAGTKAYNGTGYVDGGIADYNKTDIVMHPSDAQAYKAIPEGYYHNGCMIGIAGLTANMIAKGTTAFGIVGTGGMKTFTVPISNGQQSYVNANIGFNPQYAVLVDNNDLILCGTKDYCQYFTGARSFGVSKNGCLTTTGINWQFGNATYNVKYGGRLIIIGE